MGIKSESPLKERPKSNKIRCLGSKKSGLNRGLVLILSGVSSGTLLCLRLSWKFTGCHGNKENYILLNR